MAKLGNRKVNWAEAASVCPEETELFEKREAVAFSGGKKNNVHPGLFQSKKIEVSCTIGQASFFYFFYLIYFLDLV